MLSVLHINLNRSMLSMFSNRMFIVDQGNFQYGKLNDLYLPISVCDGETIENKEKRVKFNSVTFGNQSEDLIFAPKEGVQYEFNGRRKVYISLDIEYYKNMSVYQFLINCEKRFS
ncbi:hypothetical protein ACTFIZ_000987 [Dictyostelium cf. discoideum]